MTDSNTKIYGIDLGTTYSCISTVVGHGLVEVLPGENGTRLTRSVVGFQPDGTPVVGEVAKALETYSTKFSETTVINSIKRLMGRPDRKIIIHGREWWPEHLSACILKTLVKQAKTAGHTVENVIITVPANFPPPAREATVRAGQLAGLNVLELVEEPIAAALTYAEQTGSQDELVLVYDLGGGTFDFCVVKTSEPMTIFSSDGDRELGGEMWDDSFGAYLLSEWGIQNQMAPAECSMDGSNTRRDSEFRSIAEFYKRQLTGLQQIICDVHYDGKMASIPVNRELFDDITGGHLENTILFCESSLGIAESKGVDTSLASKILLVGGSSYMPQVKSRLEEDFNTPIQLYNPEEAVARGAALYGYKKYATGIKPVNNISHKNFGMTYSAYDDNGNRNGEKILWHIPAGSEAPFRTSFGSQTSAEGKITISNIVERKGYNIPREQPLEGPYRLDMPDGVTPIGKMQITRLESVPKGSPMNHVFYLSEDAGMLRVDSKDKLTGVTDLVEISSLNVSDAEDITDWRNFLDDLFQE